MKIHYACRTRELSAEVTVTRAYWRKQIKIPPVCDKILKVFGKRNENLTKLGRTQGDFAYDNWHE